MADDITVPPSGGKFAPHPATTCAARCVDVIDPGPVIAVFKDTKTGKDKPPQLMQKVVFVFQSGKVNPENSRPYEVSVELTQSMADNANLRKFLVSWFGGFDNIPEPAKKGKLACLVDAPALITVAHKTSRKGNEYAVIPSICPIPEGMVPPTIPAYTRAPYWAERKAERKQEEEKFLRQDTDFAKAQKPQESAEAKFPAAFSDFPEALDGGNDDLPF